MELSRKAQPDCLRYFLKLLYYPEAHVANYECNGRFDTVLVDDLIKVLINVGKYSNALAKETVSNALSDTLLMPISKTIRSSKNTIIGKEQIRCVRLPNVHEIKSSSHDLYCYECHLPGILEPCRQCVRSFHHLCYRKNPERPNYVVPSSKIQKNPLPTFSSASESDSDENETPHDTRTFLQLTNINQHSLNVISQNNSSEQNYNNEILPKVESMLSTIENTSKVSLSLDGKPVLGNMETETKCTVDVLCLGEVRPPQRKRTAVALASNVLYKNEVLPSDENETDLELCTCCRLLKYADLWNPPNVQADELCFLINCTFTRNKKWLEHDVAMYLKNLKFSTKEVDILTRALFIPSLKRLDDIHNRIKQKTYGLLMEFLIDLLDIQHAIGVFFGPYSTEMESTKWLLRDVAYDLSEIRRCPDCFRYSHDTSSTIWFAKPCLQRHELVYAKHSGFPYWPAKVIRVLSNNKYDVRFFGGNHSRALIDVRHIRAIDTELRSLKLGNSPAMKRALQELHYHQMLSRYPPSKFSFHANPDETEQIIQNVLNYTPNSEVLTLKFKSKYGRSKNKKTESNTKLIDDISFNNNNNNSNNDNHNSTKSNTDNTQAVSTRKKKSNNSIHNNRHNNNKNQLGVSSPTVCIKRMKYTEYASNSRSDDNPHYTRKKTLTTHDKEETVMLKEVAELHKKMKDLEMKKERLEIQNLKLKDTIKKHHVERSLLKRKQWCYWCLEEATFLCCFLGAYCSKKCQQRHWKDSHSAVCKNPNSNTLSETKRI